MNQSSVSDGVGLSAAPRSGSAGAGLAEVVLRRRGLALTLFAVLAALVFVIGAGERPVYQSSATLLISQDGSAADPGLIFGTQSGSFSRRPNLANHLEMLRSRELARRVVEGLSAEAAAGLKRASGPDLVAGLQRSLSARPVRDADMIRLSVRAPGAALAAELADACVAAYRMMSLERGRADISAVKEFVRGQLDVVRGRLDSSEQALASYKRSHGVANLSEETQALVLRQARVLAEYEQSCAARAGVAQELNCALGLIGGTGQGRGLDNVGPTAAAGLRDELGRTEAERTGLLIQGYADSSVRVRALVRRGEEIRRRLAGSAAELLATGVGLDGDGRVAGLQSELARLDAVIAVLKGAVDSAAAALFRIPEQERELARLTRQVEVDRQLDALLAQRYEETRIQEAGRLSAVGIVDPPRPGTRIRPDHRNNALLALLLGLVFAVSGTGAVDFFDTRLRRPEDLERHGFTVIAGIPRIAAAGAGRVALSEPDSVATEAFRVLRTGIQFAAGNGRLKVIVVSSAGAGEGKSTIAANLAVVLAQSGLRTTLLDADLRKPRLHVVFGRRRKPGVTDVVMLGADPAGALHRDITPNLEVLFAGTTPPSPVDFLDSRQFADFIERLRGSCDVVVIDTPPVLVSADATVLAARADGVIIVSRMGRSDRRALAEARMLLAQAGARTLGVVANDLRAPRRYGYYRYRYHYRYVEPAAVLSGTEPA